MKISAFQRRTLRAAFFIIGAACAAFILSASAWTAYRCASPLPAPAGTAAEDLARAVYHELSPQSPFGLARWDGRGWNAEIEPKAEAIAQRVSASAAILIDAETGDILMEKDADMIIPPASMTKLAALYTAFRAIEAGETTFDAVVELPPESWAANIPPGSSLMFLGKGQIVTVRELMEGMAVVSGNDAAIALAVHISGSVQAFTERMNREMEQLGLIQTRFEEPSGLSEFNRTTAREFAAFARIYIREYPEALQAFHSKKSFAYPLPHNEPDNPNSSPVFQRSTNRLLDALEGCDGLKTGFIYESGYNLALTVRRDGTRFISVTMNGAGRGSAEGNFHRIQDGTEMMEWAFTHFATLRLEEPEIQAIRVWKGSKAGIRLIPGHSAVFTAPAGTEAKRLVPRLRIPVSLEAPIEAGTPLGRIEYCEGERVVRSIELIADRSVEKANIAARAADSVAMLVCRMFKIS